MFLGLGGAFDSVEEFKFICIIELGGFCVEEGESVEIRDWLEGYVVQILFCSAGELAKLRVGDCQLCRAA